jgi:hypothetical protein
VDNIEMDLMEIGWGGMDWLDLAQDREYDNEPLGSINVGNFWSSCGTGSF